MDQEQGSRAEDESLEPVMEPTAEGATDVTATAVAAPEPSELEQAPPAIPEEQGGGDGQLSDGDQPAAEADRPMTMADLLNDAGNEVKSLKHGDVVEGTVVRIDPDEILVDIGGKSEGVISNRELLTRRGGRDGGDEGRIELKVGDEVLVYVLQPESPEGHAVLSLRRAGLERKWRAMQERFEAGEIAEARVIEHNKGGLIVDLGVRGFVPISQIVDFPRRPRDEQPRDAAQEIAEKLQPFMGRTLRLKILEVNRKANRLILSEKVALYEERREKRDELFSSLNVGQRVTGTVRSIAPFGVFVDLGGIDGLVHKSELSWNKVNNPETAYKIGDEVEAEVIDINHERGRISLSIRRLQPDPWQESVAKYQIGDVITGGVTKLVNFGAFVRIEEGLEGLIHISELSNARVAHPGDVVKEGDQLQLKIISLDSERHRLGLSLKQAEEPSAAVEAVGDAPMSEAVAPLPAKERRPRRSRREATEERGDFEDYTLDASMADGGEGIDNTMAAAFAESGLLDQFRSRAAQDDGAVDEAGAADEAGPADEAGAATSEASDPDMASIAVGDDVADDGAAEDAEVGAATAETADVEAVATTGPDEAPPVGAEVDSPAGADEGAAETAAPEPKPRRRTTRTASKATGDQEGSGPVA